MHGFPQSLRRRLVLLLFCLGVVFGSHVPASAQQDTGYIAGTVNDPGSGIVIGAKVAIRNESTGISKEVATASSGFYQPPPLVPGKYSISVEREGFATA